jgi:hypothetical protein
MGEGETFLEPEQSLGASQLRGVVGLIQETQQLAVFPWTELEWSHESPLGWGSCKARS